MLLAKWPFDVSVDVFLDALEHVLHQLAQDETSSGYEVDHAAGSVANACN